MQHSRATRLRPDILRKMLNPTRQLEDVRPNCGLAIAYFHTKRFTEAEAAARRAIEFSAEFSVPHALLTAALMRLGGVKEAKASARRVLTLQPSFTVRGFRMTVGLSPPVFADFAEAWREAGIPE